MSIRPRSSARHAVIGPASWPGCSNSRPSTSSDGADIGSETVALGRVIERGITEEDAGWVASPTGTALGLDGPLLSVAWDLAA